MGSYDFQKTPRYRLILNIHSKLFLPDYDKQSYEVRTGKRDKTRKPIYKSIKTDMIIFDRLGPLVEHMTNVYRYYVQKQCFDAFINDNGRWYYQEDVDAQKPKKKAKERDHAC